MNEYPSTNYLLRLPPRGPHGGPEVLPSRPPGSRTRRPAGVAQKAEPGWMDGWMDTSPKHPEKQHFFGQYSTSAWNLKHPFINGCFNWMIQNL